MTPISQRVLVNALKELDSVLPGPLELLVGGGAAMIALYRETEVTHDVDAMPIRSSRSYDELKPYFVRVAEKLDLPKDWITPYFQTFTHVLPPDYVRRTKEMFSGKKLRCIALGPEDLLVMKLMAGRQKDDRHIRRLMKWPAIEFSVVEKRLEELAGQDVRGAREALDRLDDLKEALGIG